MEKVIDEISTTSLTCVSNEKCLGGQKGGSYVAFVQWGLLHKKLHLTIETWQHREETYELHYVAMCSLVDSG